MKDIYKAILIGILMSISIWGGISLFENWVIPILSVVLVSAVVTVHLLDEKAFNYSIVASLVATPINILLYGFPESAVALLGFIWGYSIILVPIYQALFNTIDNIFFISEKVFGKVRNDKENV